MNGAWRKGIETLGALHIIWDWNGTLLDDTEAALATLNFMIAERGGTPISMPFYLDNFAWFDYIRPRNKDDIWEWRPKKEGTSLKPTVRREAPLQRLDDRRRKKKPKDEAPRDTLASSLAPQDSITYKLQDDGHVSDPPTP